MGNCSSSTVNCTVSQGPVEADLDVAGLGVVASFIISALITFSAIIIAYFSDSLPNTTMNGFDHMFLAELSKSRWNLWRLLKVVSRTVLRAVFRKGSLETGAQNFTPKDDKARKRRVKGLERFVLALSDQQLITGLCVLIAAFSTRCSMSFYHFRIISALAWFSSTTHLSTLSVLRVYLIEHPSIRNWRVLGMLCVLAMLITVQVVSDSGQDGSLPVQCAFASPSPSYSGVLYYTYQVIVYRYLVVSYSDRVIRLYSYDPDFSVQGWLGETVQRQILRKRYGRILPTIIFRASRNSGIEAGEACRSMKERIRMANLAVLEETKKINKLRVLLWTNTELGYTFLSEILTLTFGVTYGVTQIIVARNAVPAQGLAQNQNIMTFGQILPLLLIALPFLQAGEVYYEYYDSIKSASHTTVDLAGGAHDQAPPSEGHDTPKEKLFFTIAKLRRESSPWYGDNIADATSISAQQRSQNRTLYAKFALGLFILKVCFNIWLAIMAQQVGFLGFLGSGIYVLIILGGILYITLPFHLHSLLKHRIHRMYAAGQFE